MSNKKTIEKLTKASKGHSVGYVCSGVTLEVEKVGNPADEVCPEVTEVKNTSNPDCPVDYIIHLYPKSMAVSFYKIGPDLKLLNRFYTPLDADFKNIKNQIEDYLKEINEIINTYRKSECEDIEDWGAMTTKDISNRMSEKGDVIKKVGGSLYKCLSLSQQLSEELREATQGKSIWIFCEDEEVFSLWEWIYHDNSRSKEGFFWGDKFLLIRVPKGYKSKKINKIRINDSLLVTDSEKYSIKLRDYLIDKLEEQLTGMPIPEEQSNHSLHSQSRRLNNKSNSCSFDAIFVEAKEASEKMQNYLTKDVKTEDDRATFVFLNNCRDPSGIFGNNETMPTSWIETSFEIDSYVSYLLAKSFYDELLNDKKKSVAEAFMEGKKKSQLLLEHELGKNDWIHAYVICGNPFVKVDKVELK